VAAGAIERRTARTIEAVGRPGVSGRREVRLREGRSGRGLLESVLVAKAAGDMASDHAVVFGKLVTSWPGDISRIERILWNARIQCHVRPAAIVVDHPVVSE
jgi:hypothetical protein